MDDAASYPNALFWCDLYVKNTDIKSYNENLAALKAAIETIGYPDAIEVGTMGLRRLGVMASPHKLMNDATTASLIDLIMWRKRR